MVESAPQVYGLDRYGDSVFLAQVAIQPDRNRIVKLAQVPVSEVDNILSTHPRTIVVAVEDCQVMVKRLSLPSESPISVADYARFELEQSLLDAPDHFCIDSHYSGSQKSMLGFVARRENVLQCVRKCGLRNDATGVSTVGGRTRSLALGLGYSAFCVPEPGKMICLADIGADAVSISILSENHVAAVSHIAFGPGDLQTFDGRHRLAVELRTIVNFLSDSLIASDVTIPVSRLIVGGPGVNSEVVTVLQSYFSVGVVRPKINTGYLAKPDEMYNIEAERFIVALGLTAQCRPRA